MFFFEIERLSNLQKQDEAKELLRWGRRRSKRITKNSQFNTLCTQLDLHDLIS